MTNAEALKNVRHFSELSNPSEEQEFTFTESLGFLIENTKDPKYMMELGGYYYGEEKFDLALKYYEMAAECGHEYADECLGYIWYYGRTGERNYEKAFHYYSRAAKRGSLVCQYKVADMYKNGYYVEKDYEKYKEIIEELFTKVRNAQTLGAPVPEIFTRLARIRTEEGRTGEAIELYLYAKDFLAQRISYNAFFGNLSIMKCLIEDLYKLIDPDREEMDLYDLYEVLKKPEFVSFSYKNRRYMVIAAEEDGEIVIGFNRKWYRTVDDFFRKAAIRNKKLTAIYDELTDFRIEDLVEVEEWN